MPWPAPWTALFGRDAPLSLEIGFGNGEFLLALATSRPEMNVVGIEISLPSLRKAIGKASRRGLGNVRVVRGDAQGALWALFVSASVQRVYLNFPDPWPKASHAERRLVHDRFLHLLATRLAPGATVDIATDHPAYAETIQECLVNSLFFESRLDVPYVTEDRERLRTKYEQIALAEGRTCRYFKWRRTGRPAANLFPIPQEMPMPHVVMSGPLSLEQIAAQFASTTYSEEGGAVRFIDLFVSTEKRMLLLDTHIEEEPVSQRLALLIRARGDGAGRRDNDDGGDSGREEERLELILSLHDLGFPRPTAGVHRALNYLAQWLEQLHPEMRVERSTLKVGA